MPVRNLSPLVTQQRDFLGICILPGSKNSHWRLIGCSWGWLRAKALDSYSCNHTLEEPNSHCLLETKHIRSIAELPGPSAVWGDPNSPLLRKPGQPRTLPRQMQAWTSPWASAALDAQMASLLAGADTSWGQACFLHRAIRERNVTPLWIWATAPWLTGVGLIWNIWPRKGHSSLGTQNGAGRNYGAIESKPKDSLASMALTVAVMNLNEFPLMQVSEMNLVLWNSSQEQKQAFQD